MPGVSTREKVSSLPFLFLILTCSLILISLVSWAIWETVDISSPSQSWQILFAKVDLPPFGGPYNPSLIWLFLLKGLSDNLLNKLFKNDVTILFSTHPCCSQFC